MWPDPPGLIAWVLITLVAIAIDDRALSLATFDGLSILELLARGTLLRFLLSGSLLA